jgi:hypothetical protein
MGCIPVVGNLFVVDNSIKMFSIKRVRELRTIILNELFNGKEKIDKIENQIFKEQGEPLHAKTGHH